MNYDRIESVFEDAFLQKGISGTVSIFNKSDCVFTTSKSDSSRPFYTALGQQTSYGLASGAKLYTALAILTLIDQHEITFDTTLASVLDKEFPSINPDITVFQLLTHTSGISDYYNECEVNGYQKTWQNTPVYTIRKPDDFKKLISKCNSSDNNDREFSYKNSGYILLGLILEKVTESDFHTYLQGHLFNKIGMTASGYYSTDDLPQHATVGYLNDRDKWKANIHSIPAVGGGEGGAYSSADDLHKLWRFIISGELLSPKLTDHFLSPQVQDGCDGEWFYAFGYWINIVAGKVIKYTCIGEDPGCSIRYFYYPESDTALSVFTNTSSGSGELSVQLQKQLLGSSPGAKDEPQTLSSCTTALSSCNG